MKRKYFIYAAMFAALAWGCGHAEHSHEKEEETEEHAHHDDDEVVLSAAQQERIGLTTSVAKAKDFHGVIAVGGTLQSSPTDATTIVAPASGQVRLSPNIVEGALVNIGSTMFTIDTDALAETSASTKAQLALNAASKQLERARALMADQLISQRELDLAQAEYDAALAEHSAATKRGKSMVNVSASMQGYITGCMVRTGDYIEAGQTLATLTRGRSMLLRAEVPERHFARLADIVSAHFKPSYNNNVYDIEALGGRLMAREATTQQNGGYITVTFSFDNRDALVPGCYTEVWLQTRTTHNALCVPASALVREGDIYYIFVQDDETCFEKREVRIGDSNGAETEILDGLQQGERVVVSGAPQLAIAASARVIPAHTHNH